MDDGPSFVVGFILFFIALFFIGGGIAGCMYIEPQYRVWQQRLSGEAALAEAESSRRIAIEEAKALQEAAEHKAQAEIIRARGVAEANKIISEGLGGPEGYLRYLWIDSLAARDNIIYVPTEAGLPILEAGKR